MRIQRRPIVTVFVRHAGKCANDGQEFYRGCQCPKWIRYSLNGKQHRVAAMTRAWAVAEEKAQEMQRSLDAGDAPLAVAVSRTTIAEAMETHLIQKSDSTVQAQSRMRLLRHQLQMFVDYAASRGKVEASKLTADDLIHYRATWAATWKSGITRAKAQTNLRGFLRFLNRTDLLSALTTIKESKEDKARTAPKPFSESELKLMLSKVGEVFDPVKGPRITALIHLMASTGLAMRDAVGLRRSSIANGVLDIKRQKTEKHVVQRLNPALHAELLAVTNGNPQYVFWSGQSTPDNMTAVYQRDLVRLMVASGVYIPGNVGHRFRDTAVDFWLGKGYAMTDVAAMIGDSVSVCEKHYADLASKRMQDRLAKMPVREWQ